MSNPIEQVEMQKLLAAWENLMNLGYGIPADIETQRKILKHLRSLEQDHKAMKEALQFYADQQFYETIRDIEDVLRSEVIEFGDKARKCISSLLLK